MPISNEKTFLIIAVAAICTVLTRAIPFLLFGGKKEVPAVIRYLGGILPASIMAILVIYCLKGVNLFVGNHGLPELIGVGVTAGLHLWKRNTLLSVAGGTILYMILVQL